MTNMRDGRALDEAATRRIGFPVGAVLVALVLTVVAGRGPGRQPEFPLGAGLTAEDQRASERAPCS